MRDFDVHLKQGQVWHENGRFAQAIHHYTQALQLQPDEAIAYELRAVAYYDQGQHQAALSDFNQVIQLNPFNDVAHWAKGKIFAAMGDHLWAMSSFSRAIELNGDEADYYRDRAKTWRQLGRVVEAEQDEGIATALEDL
jgi:tetratricopeptide (TPR) repeat protein